MSNADCKSLWRRIWEHLSVPLDEGTEFAGSADDVAAKLATEEEEVASALLAQAEQTAAEPHERADGAERRATTLQGAVAIAASFGLASAALLLDSNKIHSDGWRQTFAIVSFGFVFCLVAAGFRAVGAVYRVHRWRFPDNEEIYLQAKMKSPEAKTRRAAALLRTVARNQAIARWKVAYMRAAAWWFRLALLFLLADALLLAVYAFFGTRIPHLHLPFQRSHRLDLFFAFFPFAAWVVAVIGLLIARAGRRDEKGLDKRQIVPFVVLLLNAVVVGVADHFLRGWRVQTPCVRYLGVLVAVLAYVWVGWSYKLLGTARSGRYEPRSDARLQTGGAYAVVRHPIYLGFVLAAIAGALLFSPLVLLIVVGLLLVGYDAARVEERLLRAKYGADYARYMRCTPNRILPFDRLLLK